jgi:hypothetical protein
MSRALACGATRVFATLQKLISEFQQHRCSQFYPERRAKKLDRTSANAREKGARPQRPQMALFGFGAADNQKRIAKPSVALCRDAKHCLSASRCGARKHLLQSNEK